MVRGLRSEESGKHERAKMDELTLASSVLLAVQMSRWYLLRTLGSVSPLFSAPSRLMSFGRRAYPSSRRRVELKLTPPPAVLPSLSPCQTSCPLPKPFPRPPSSTRTSKPTAPTPSTPLCQPTPSRPLARRRSSRSPTTVSLAWDCSRSYRECRSRACWIRSRSLERWIR